MNHINSPSCGAEINNNVSAVNIFVRQNMLSIIILGSFNTRRSTCVYFYHFYFRTSTVILWNKSKLMLLAIYQPRYPVRSLKNRELIFDKNKLSITKPCFRIFFTHLPRMAGFKKFTPALPQALGFNLPLKKAGGFCDHPSLRVEFKLRKTSESCSKQTSF